MAQGPGRRSPCDEGQRHPISKAEGAVKKFFADYRFLVKAEAKKRGLTLEAWYELAKPFLKKGLEDWHIGDSEHPQVYNHYYAEFRAIFEKCPHFFIESEGHTNFLKGCVKKISYNDFCSVAENEHQIGIIHPCSKGDPAYLFNLARYKKHFFVSCVEYSGGKYAYSVLSSNVEEVLQNSEAGRHVRFVFGVLKYMAAFPERVRKGFPDCGKHPTHYKGKKCLTLEIDPSVVSNPGDPTPHFVSGHFRTLLSERYTKKRFQEIWVSEYFTGGTPFTVHER
jgi:hypothetical protein